jgi:predicted nucleic acid-binding protein
MGRIDDERKYRLARTLIETKLFGLSGQVLAEFYTNVTNSEKHRDIMPSVEVDQWMTLLGRYPIAPVDEGIVANGIAHSRRYQISYWDGAILAAAERLNAPILYTEDLNHDQAYGSVRVVNPFRVQ